MINIETEVLDFIDRRFLIGNFWKSGNCYFFALILQSRFNRSIIFYDVVDGHFFTRIGDNYYDLEGIYNPTTPIEWDNFEEYNPILKQIIIRDCIV